MSNVAPKFTIITPSLNQGGYLEETIRSVLSQGYSNLEYIIMDGGSTDETLDILRKYSGQLTWFSEADAGQAQAINKGLRMATGEIISYLNADDILKPGALEKVAQVFISMPEVQWLTGCCVIVDEHSDEIRRLITAYKKFLLGLRSSHILLVVNYISQPATFWRRQLLQTVGYYNEELHYALDYDYWLRLWKVHPPYYLKDCLAGFRIQQHSKTVSLRISRQWVEEEHRVIAQHTDSRFWLAIHDAQNKVIEWAYSALNR